MDLGVDMLEYLELGDGKWRDLSASGSKLNEGPRGVDEQSEVLW